MWHIQGDFQFEQFKSTTPGQPAKKLVRIAAANVLVDFSQGKLENGSGGLLIYSGQPNPTENGMAGILKGKVTLAPDFSLDVTAESEIALSFNNTTRDTNEVISVNGTDVRIQVTRKTFGFGLANA